MIPYDDLVAALSAWRARQGLPVSTMGAPPAKAQPVDDALSVDEAELVDEQYDDGGGDYAMKFNKNEEETEIGGTPDRPTDPNDFGSGGRRW
jgi:hypothetical protein